MDKQKLFTGIQKYIECSGGSFSSWCAGLSQDRDFFNAYGLSEAEDLWIGGAAATEESAIQVLEQLCKLGVRSLCDHAGNGCFVYVFQKTRQ